MKKLLLLACLCSMGFSLSAQQARSKDFQIGRQATVDVSQITVDYRPLLQRLEAPFPGGESEKAKLQAIKDEIAKRYEGREEPASNGQELRTAGGPGDPWVGTNFQGNNYINGVPNDNDMAISNGGKVVSVINSNIFMLDENGTLLQDVSLDAWAAPLGLSASKYDPRALYDPIHDRFIIACLNGFTDSTSMIVLGFSQTNDPTGGWNLYALPGDPNNDSLWTDYPIMALTSGELFLTGNLLYNDQPWQTGFVESVCWQIGLDEAYAGDSLDTRLWFDVLFGGAPVRNLCPVQGGSSPTGPNMYMVSNRNFATANDTVFLMEITDTIGAPGAQFLVDYVITDMEYGVPPVAIQQFNQLLSTNDGRWLDAFIENGNIQFVGNTLDTASGKCAAYHGIIMDVTGTRTTTGKVVGGGTLHYGYPGICWMGMAPGTDEALIGFNYTGNTTTSHPGCAAVYYDGAGGYSDRVVARAGQGFINLINGADRWGDYFGIQTRYNQPGAAWIAGTYGLANHSNSTWIAEFNHPSIVSKPEIPAQDFEMSLGPNPTMDLVNLEFRLEADDFLEIAVYDLQGRQVHLLLRDRVRAGVSRFTFSTEPLAAGVYTLAVRSRNGIVAQARVVKAH